MIGFFLLQLNRPNRYPAYRPGFAGRRQNALKITTLLRINQETGPAIDLFRPASLALTRAAVRTMTVRQTGIHRSHFLVWGRNECAIPQERCNAFQVTD
jgi:hypothetical protein